MLYSQEPAAGGTSGGNAAPLLGVALKPEPPTLMQPSFDGTLRKPLQLHTAAAVAVSTAVTGDASGAPTIANQQYEEVIAEILSRVIRSGPLSRKGGITNWKQRWLVLGSKELATFKDSRTAKAEFNFDITPDTEADLKSHETDQLSLFTLRKTESGSSGSADTGATEERARSVSNSDTALGRATSGDDSPRTPKGTVGKGEMSSVWWCCW